MLTRDAHIRTGDHLDEVLRPDRPLAPAGLGGRRPRLRFSQPYRVLFALNDQISTRLKLHKKQICRSTTNAIN